MRKGLAYLFRYREVSLQANARYLRALASVEDPTDAESASDIVSARQRKDQAGRCGRGCNPLTRRWRVTAHSRQVMGTSFYPGEYHFPTTYAEIAE